MSDLFKDIPEFVEVDLGESVAARTETLSTFRELGPPDLCHVIKSTGKTTQKDMGSYHYCSGVEASSSASLAAYLNSLTFAVEDSSAWFGKGNGWRVRSGTYCCFNAFSRVDMRVEAKIPGGVDAYIVDLRGDRHEATPALWQETYMSALLRAIRYADDASYRLAGYRKLDPITTPEAEIRFLKAAEALFFKDPEIQVATVVSNHLTAGIMKYFADSFRLDKAANLFEKLHAKDPEVAALLARSYIGMNEEVKAVQIMHSALELNSQSYPTLHAQCDFLMSKGKTDWALQVAQQAVNSAPSEFVTWAKLTEAYIELGQYDSALLTLNSCPMFTFNERDLHRMPTPAKTHLPIKKFISESGILDEDSTRDNEADVALLRLPAPGLRGTFAQAYALLTRLVSQIGWDELLKTRSHVFVMEEEYRIHKSRGSVDASALASEGTAAPDADDDASTRAVRSPVNGNGVETPASSDSPAGPATARSTVELKVPQSARDIPTIRISSESDREREHVIAHSELETKLQNEVVEEIPEEDESPPNSAASVNPPPLEKPQLAQVPADGEVHAHEDGEDEEQGFSFSNKRLCERWLDNLFLVLYEDLRVYTIWRAEISHFKTQHMSYRKTGTEWEILGELAQRLHHKEEAKDAFQRCLEAKFSAKALLKLLESYAEEGDLQRTLNTAIRLTTYHHRWYMDASYPSMIAHYLFKLGLVHGHAKIQYTLLSMNLPNGIFEIMQGYLKYGATFNVEGSEF